MNILQILPRLDVGGVERGTLDLARELVRRGHKAVVISSGGRMVAQLEDYGAIHYDLPVHKKSPFTIFSSIAKVRQIIRDENINIVHARSRIPGLIAFLAARGTEATFITTCHGYYRFNFFGRVMGWGKLVIAPSEKIKEHMYKDFGVFQERLRVIPRGVDLEDFEFSKLQFKTKKDYVIGIIGRLTPLKGHIYGIRAFSELIKRYPYLQLHIIGESSPGKEKYLEELSIQVKGLGLSNYVKFLGFKNDVAGVLDKIDILLVPSIVPEAFGRVIIEAQARGVAVIATNLGGAAEIIRDGINGILVPPRDYHTLATRALELIRNKDLLKRIILNGKKSVEKNFSLTQMVEKTLKVYAEALKSQRFLVIKLSALGDVVLAIPSLRALKEKFPHAHIEVLTQERFKLLLENCPYVNRIIADDGGKSSAWQGVFKFSEILRNRAYDAVIDLQNNRRSHLLAYLSLSKKRYGYRNKKLGFLLNSSVCDKKGPLSPVRHQARVLKLLGINRVREDLELSLRPEALEKAKDFLYAQGVTPGEKILGINIGGSNRWQTKRWPVDCIAQLCKQMDSESIKCVITGGPQDENLSKKLKKTLGVKVIDTAGETNLEEFLALIKQCSVYLTTDSAPLHIAVALKVPVVVLFGPTDPGRHLPARGKYALLYRGISCSPCYRRRCQKLNCMREISPSQVYKAVKKFL